MTRKQVTQPLVFDIHSSLAINPNSYELLRATLIHTLLFNQSIILPDSVAIQNRNFRKLIDRDVHIGYILDKDNFSIAYRAEGNNTLQLLNKRMHGKQLKDDDDYSWGNYQSLEMLDQKATRVDWDYGKIANNFLDMMLDYFEDWESESNKYKGDEIIYCIRELDEERKKDPKRFNSKINKQSTTSIGLDVFTKDILFKYLEQSVIFLTEGDKNKIVEYAKAAYFGNMPQFLQADPTCSKEQQQYIDLLSASGSSEDERIFDTIKIPTKLNASQFIHGLNSLAPEDVHVLRDSKAFKQLVSARQNLKSNDADVKELRHIFEVYTMLISDKILQKNSFLNTRTNAANTTFLETTVGEYISFALSFVLDESIAYSGFLASHIFRHVVPKTHAMKVAKEKQREELFSQYSDQLNRTDNSKRIEAEETFTKDGVFERMAVLGSK